MQEFIFITGCCSFRQSTGSDLFRIPKLAYFQHKQMQEYLKQYQQQYQKMGNIGSQSKRKSNSSQIISYEEYLERRPKASRATSLSMCGDHSGISILHNIYSFDNVDKKKLQQYLGMLQQLRNVLDCDNLYLPIMYKIDQSESYCHEDQKFQMFFEYYEGIMNQQVASRRRDKDFFSEEEAWYILFSLVKACRKFEKFKMSSGPLTTEMILVNPKGHLKLKNILSSPNIEEEATFNFEAPEQLKNKREHRESYCNPNVCQTFSIGVVLLEVCSLIDGSSIYDLKRNVINQSMFNQLLNFIQKRYSKLLVSLIRTMLSFSDADRPLPSQIYETFKPYDKKILSLKPFKFVPTPGSKLK